MVCSLQVHYIQESRKGLLLQRLTQTQALWSLTAIGQIQCLLLELHLCGVTSQTKSPLSNFDKNILKVYIRHHLKAMKFSVHSTLTVPAVFSAQPPANV